MKLWQKRDEWTALASCGGDIDFIIAPADLGPDRTDAVIAKCAGCPVRAECITAACVDAQDNSVWVAGEWLPDAYTAPSRRDLAAMRASLVESLPRERSTRPTEAL